MRDHPGGADVLIDVAGKDATEEYTDIGHSEDADEIVGSYLVGMAADHDNLKRSKNIKLMQQSTASAKKESAKVPAGSLALVGAAYCALLYGRAPCILFSRLLRLINFSVLPGDIAFVGGFAVAGVIFMIGATIVANKLSNFTWIDSGFTRYPPRHKAQHHMKPGNPPPRKGLVRREEL